MTEDLSLYTSLPASSIVHHEIKYVWPIGGIKEVLALDFDVYKSCEFFCGETKWSLELHVILPKIGIKTPLSIKLILHETKYERLATKCNIFLVNRKGEVEIKVEYSGCIKKEELREVCSIDFEMDELKVFCVEDVLKVYVNVDVSRVELLRHGSLKKEGTLEGIVPALLTDSTFSDFRIRTVDRELRVHRAVLAGRSPVFRAMFKEGSLEAGDGAVLIDDVDSSLVEAMVTYVYTGAVPGLPHLAEGLLLLADRYRLTSLKDECQVILMSSLSVGNVLKRINLAKIYDCQPLKEACYEFIQRNFQIIFPTAEQAALFFSDHSIT